MTTFVSLIGEHVWVKDKTRLETMIANIATDLKKTDANVAKASALAAVANDNAAEAMKTAAAMSTVHSTAQGCANDVKVGMGCSTSQVVVEPGDYQLVTEDVCMFFFFIFKISCDLIKC